MRLKSLRICNFRCFGPAFVTVDVDAITTLVGGNGSGKTAILEALARLFGTSQHARTLQPDDFHVPEGQQRDSVAERQLILEARFEFPSLEAEGAEDPMVPAVFEQMAVEEPQGAMFCRVRLTGTWTRTQSVDGIVETRLEWLLNGDEEPSQEARRTVAARDRDRVRVLYVPAARDAAKHFANASGTFLHHLLSAVDWDHSIRETVREAGETLTEAFAKQPAVQKLNESCEAHWAALYDEWLYRKPSFRLTARRMEDAVRAAQIVFNPTHGAHDHALERLSEGQQSLFYFAFLATMFDVQREAYAAKYAPSSISSSGEATQTPFSYEKLQPAALTIFAVEEPENHLAPQYLGRIVERLSKLTDGGGAQIVIASHAAAVLARVEPRSVRHVRRDATAHESRVRPITLPESATDAEKYVRQAVRAFPELYFARAVVLCEGDSEELLLPRFARLHSEDLDLALVSVVPLGGRHVNHFWKLLRDLEIPFVTLLDLDRERSSGGWERIHYVVTQLCAFLDPSSKSALLGGPKHSDDPIAEGELAALRERDDADSASLNAWVEHLRDFDVFFSAPLDIDFLMLEAYQSAYMATLEEGGIGPQGNPERARARVLGKSATASSYTPEQDALFPWYAYLFLGKGKPSTHTAAWIQLTEDEARSGMPTAVRNLLDALNGKLTSATHNLDIAMPTSDSGHSVAVANNVIEPEEAVLPSTLTVPAALDITSTLQG